MVPLLLLNTQEKKIEITNELIFIVTENAITSMSLPLLGASEIKEMLPVIGHRVLFMRNLEEWRRAMHPNASNSYESQEISSCRSQIQNETLSFSLNDILPGFDKIDSFDSTVLVENTQLTPQSIKNMESCTSSIDVSNNCPYHEFHLNRKIFRIPK